MNLSMPGPEPMTLTVNPADFELVRKAAQDGVPVDEPLCYDGKSLFGFAALKPGDRFGILSSGRIRGEPIMATVVENSGPNKIGDWELYYTPDPVHPPTAELSPEMARGLLGLLTRPKVVVEFEAIGDFTAARLPTKARAGDAGFDLHCPSWDGVVLESGRTTQIPLGIASVIPEGWAALLLGRSGLGSKGLTPLGFAFEENGVLRMGGLIDSGYRGEWVLLLHNLGETVTIRPGDKVAQFILIEVPEAETRWADGPLPESERGTGGLGSTDAKGGGA